MQCWFSSSTAIFDRKAYGNGPLNEDLVRTISTRVNTIFYGVWNLRAFFRCYIAGKKRAGFSNHIKNCVLESCRNIFFPLDNFFCPVLDRSKFTLFRCQHGLQKNIKVSKRSIFFKIIFLYSILIHGFVKNRLVFFFHDMKSWNCLVFPLNCFVFIVLDTRQKNFEDIS